VLFLATDLKRICSGDKMSLKLLLISVAGTIANDDNKIDSAIMQQLAKLIKQLTDQGVHVALWSNRSWIYNKSVSLHEHISQLAGVKIGAHGWGEDGKPSRRLGDAALPVLEEYGVEKHETMLLGGTDEDMRAGVNSNLLYIRADWYGQQSTYGFSVKNVSELARFCFVFALRKHPLFFHINAGGLQYYSAGPFSTMVEAYALFGDDAKQTAKFGQGHPEFWFYLAISTLYFSGLLSGVQYICTYPGHEASSAQPKEDSLQAALMRLGKCFRMNFYHDLILRHAAAAKSQPVKAAQRTFVNQLQSIRLSAHPHRNFSTEPNKGTLSLKGKVVLVVDDICTSGRSLEAARAFIEAAGGQARLFTWLRTINTPFWQLTEKQSLKPYQANVIKAEPPSMQHSYAAGIADHQAPQELAQVFGLYSNWSWK
jgi:Phosphoribosyl transferase domain